MNAAREDFDLNMQMRDREVNKEFFRRLKEKGYDAIEDQFSRKVDGTEGNLIILDPKSSLKRSSTREVKFDESGKYAGTTTKKEGDKRYKAELEAAEKQKAVAKKILDNMNAASKEVTVNKIGNSAASVKKRNLALKEKYGLTEGQFIAMLASNPAVRRAGVSNNLIAVYAYERKNKKRT